MFTKMRTILTNIILLIVTRTVSPMCNYENSVELTNRTYNGILYEEGEYYVDNTTGLERGCVCMKEKCFRKCCPFGQGYLKKKKTCVDLPEEFKPHIWEGFEEKPGFNATAEFHFFFSRMNCNKTNNEFRIALNDATKNYHFETDGRLHATEGDNKSGGRYYSADKYCADNFLTEADEKRNRTVEFNGLICYSPEVKRNHYGVSASCMLISCFFIILTVAVYVFLPELRTLHGMVMITYLLSFFVAFLFMATMQILLLVDNITIVYCTSMTFVIYFSVLSAFFWLNVMCYDLWSKLRSSRNMAHGFSSSNRTRFLLYCAYAFGIPTLLTILLAALEFSDLPKDILLLPHIRRKGCFLYGMSKLLYLYSPILVLCVANLILFILTALRLAEMKKQTQTLLKKRDTQRFSLYIKLFIVTGINWILEVVSSFYPNAEHFWTYTDAYNVLVGLIIFIIFICKKKILKSIKRRYQHLRGIQPTAATNTSTVTTISTVSVIETNQRKGDIQMKTNIAHTKAERTE